jgi:hypothetical protein
MIYELALTGVNVKLYNKLVLDVVYPLSDVTLAPKETPAAALYGMLTICICRGAL